MTNAIEVLKELKDNPCSHVDIHQVGMDIQSSWTEANISKELDDAIEKALLALESLDSLEKWLNKKYTENWFVLTNNKDLEEARIIRNFIKEVRGVLEK